MSQSGSLIGALLSRADARGIGFSRLISVGNEVDLAVGEIADLLVDDPETKRSCCSWRPCATASGWRARRGAPIQRASR